MSGSFRCGISSVRGKLVVYIRKFQFFSLWYVFFSRCLLLTSSFCLQVLFLLRTRPGNSVYHFTWFEESVSFILVFSTLPLANDWIQNRITLTLFILLTLFYLFKQINTSRLQHLREEDQGSLRAEIARYVLFISPGVSLSCCVSRVSWFH